jgi:hypothetical protein
MFRGGYTKNISMEAIYGIDYNSSIYQFTNETMDTFNKSTTTIYLTPEYIAGLDGSFLSWPGELLGLSLLSSTRELCATFLFLWDCGVKEYALALELYAEPDRDIQMKGFMSLPNQMRSFDRFELFGPTFLLANKTTAMDFSVTSVKILQKRNTVAEPCIHVDNYDKVCSNLFL